MSRFKDASAVVTDASHGLGLTIARQLAQRGARLVICGSDSESLNKAAWQLRDTGAKVHPVRCNLTQDGAAQKLLAEAEHLHGGLDLLVNNPDITAQAHPSAPLREEDFRQAMETLYFAPLRLTLAALPLMRQHRNGTIINITPPGAPPATPHPAPYDAARFAFTGLSKGMRTELADERISVTTVLPGALRTSAKRHGRPTHQHTRSAPAAPPPLLFVDADHAARAILRAAEHRRAEITLGGATQIAARLDATTTHAASLATRLVDQATRPHSAPGPTRPDAGADHTVQSRLFGVLTALNDRAARHLNQPR